MTGAISKPVQRDIWKDAMQSHPSFNIVMMGGPSISTEETRLVRTVCSRYKTEAISLHLLLFQTYMEGLHQNYRRQIV